MHVMCRSSRLAAAMSALRKPRYNGKCLRNLIMSMLGETRVSDTLTNVIIPTFDVRLLQPIIFSTYDVRTPPAAVVMNNQSAVHYCTWLHAY